MNLNLPTKTAYADKSSFDMSKLANNLPIFNHISKDEISTTGTKQSVLNISRVLFILTLIAAGYLTWVYILPIVGVMLQAFVAVGFLLIIFLARNSIFSIMKNIARWIDKQAIEQDPIAVLQRQREKIVQSKVKFSEAINSISVLRKSTGDEKERQVKLANHYKSEVEKSRKSLLELREKIKEFNTPESKETDQYSDFIMHLDNESSRAQRNEILYNQSNALIEKYGMRESAMSKLFRKLKHLGNRIDIKIHDFDATVEILKKELEFSKSGRRATEQAKKALMFDTPWEVEYALEVTVNSISTNLAMTEMNLQDVTKISEDFSFDNDEIFERVDKLADRFSTGEEKVNSGNKYKNPDFKPTNSEIERTGSSAFEKLF